MSSSFPSSQSFAFFCANQTLTDTHAISPLSHTGSDMAQSRTQNAVDALSHKLDNTHVSHPQQGKSSTPCDATQPQQQQQQERLNKSSVPCQSSSVDVVSTGSEVQEESRMSEATPSFVAAAAAAHGFSSPELLLAVYDACEYFPINGGGNQVMDCGYVSQPYYDESFGMNVPSYASYSFHGVDSSMGDCAFVNQPFLDSFSSALQFPPQGSIAYAYGPPQVFQYPAYQHAPPQGCQYPSYTSPMHAGGVLILDPQDTVQAGGGVVSNGVPNVNAFSGPLPGAAFPHGGMMMIDPGQQGVIVSNQCNAVPAPILGLGLPASLTPELQGAIPQQVIASNGLVNASATSGLTVGFPVNPVPPCENMPGALPYPAVYHDDKAMVAFQGWDRSESPVGFPTAIFHQPTNPVQGFPPNVVHPTSNNSISTKTRTPLLDVTPDFNTSDGGFSWHKVENRLNTVTENKNRQISKQRAEGNLSGGTFQRTRVEWTPAYKQPEGQRQKPKSPDKECSLPSDPPNEQEQYNIPDFVTEYDDAKHFIIKSFSEANVRQSIKHKVWASTSHGNRKLDLAYQEAQSRAGGKPNGCPVFLFFSINGSGHFCGVAEMVGRVDYCKTAGCWDRERWSGSFPVKWHIVKNVPNTQLHGIILQNNESKPVTSSRDTQEVSFQQGLEMLKIFKKYFARSRILDDYSYAHQNSQSGAQDSPNRPQKVCQLPAKVEENKACQAEERENIGSVSV